MQKNIWGVVCLLVSSLCFGEYGGHLGGSGIIETTGNLALCGDNVFAHADDYYHDASGVVITGEPVQTQVANEFSGWTVTNSSVANQSIVGLNLNLTAPDAIVLGYGIGDLRVETAPALFKSTYKTLISNLKATHPSAKIYLCNLSPVQKWYRNYDTVMLNYDAYQTALSEIATEEGITLIDLYELNVQNPKYFVDGLIPVMYGAEFIAEQIKEVVTGSVTASMPAIFTDGMVLQRGQPIPVFGRGKPGDSVSVTWDATGSNEVKNTTVDSHGYWMVKLSAKGTISTAKTVDVTVGSTNFNYTDVLVGDVWYATGQSNMASVNVGQDTDADEANNFPVGGYPNLRLLHMTEKYGGAQSDFYDWGESSSAGMARFDYWDIANGGWYAADAYSDVSNFSAVAYFFAKQVHLDTGVPVGIIECAVGGTPIESYIPYRGFLGEAEIAAQVTTEDEDLGGMLVWPEDAIGNINWSQANIPYGRATMTRNQVPFPYHPMEHSFLFSSGMEIFIPYGIKGVVWYQGETNADAGAPVSINKAQYRALINGWRDEWSRASGMTEDFALIITQLPVINASSRSDWPTHRQAYYEFWQESNYSSDSALQIPRVGMAVTLEYGATGSGVHPHDKSPVSKRLARVAQRYAYDNNSYFYSGPRANDLRIDGSDLYVQFEADTIGAGLAAYDNPAGTLDYFEIAGSNGVYYDATATIVGNEVKLVSASVTEPVAARYCFHMCPFVQDGRGRTLDTGKAFLLAASPAGAETPATNDELILTATPFVLGEESFDVEPDPIVAGSEGFTDGWEMDSITPPNHWSLDTGDVTEIVTEPTGESALHIKTTSNASNAIIFVGHDNDLSYWDTAICADGGKSFSIEARVRIASGSGQFTPDNADAFITATLTPNNVNFNGVNFAVDLSSKYATLRYNYFKLTDTLELYCNGTLVSSKQGVSGDSRSRIFLGDGTGGAQVDMYVDYLRYEVGTFTNLIPSAPDYYVVDCDFEESEKFTTASSGTFFSDANHSWELNGAQVTTASPISDFQSLLLSDGDTAAVTLVKNLGHDNFGIKEVKIKAIGSQNMTGALSLSYQLDDTSWVAAASKDISTATDTLTWLIDNNDAVAVRFEYSGVAAETVTLDELTISTFSQEITTAEVLNGTAITVSRPNEEVVINQTRLVGSSGITLYADKVAMSIQDEIADDFPSKWSNLKLYYGQVDDFSQATELSNFDYDLSDVPLYKTFIGDFNEVAMVAGDNYFWMTGEFVGDEATYPSFACAYFGFSNNSQVNPVEPVFVEPGYIFDGKIINNGFETIHNFPGAFPGTDQQDQLLNSWTTVGGEYVDASSHTNSSANGVRLNPAESLAVTVHSGSIPTLAAAGVIKFDASAESAGGTVQLQAKTSGGSWQTLTSFTIADITTFESFNHGITDVSIYSDYQFVNNSGVDIVIDDVELSVNTASYLSSTCTQRHADVSLAAIDAELIGLEITINGDTYPQSLSAVELSLLNSAAINKIKVYSTGNSPQFVVDNLEFEGTVSGDTTTLTGIGAQLVEGVNYLWLAIDVESSANIYEPIDADVINFTLDNGYFDGTFVPTNGAPSGRLTIVPPPSGNVVECGFEVADHFDVNKDGTGAEVASDVAYMSASESITDSKGNIWTTSGDLKNWAASNNFLGSGACAEWNHSSVGSFWEVEVPAMISAPGNFSFQAKRGTSGSTDMEVKAWNRVTKSWDILGTIINFNASTVIDYSYPITDVFAYTKFRVQVTARGSKSRVHFDNVLLTTTEVTYPTPEIITLIGTGFEEADGFPLGADNVVLPSPMTDSLGNTWTHKDLKRYGIGDNDFMDNLHVEFNDPVLGSNPSFFAIAINPTEIPEKLVGGTFSYEARGGTTLNNDWNFEGYTETGSTRAGQWEVLDTVTAFTTKGASEAVSHYIADVSKYSSYRIIFTGGSDLDRIHFDNISFATDPFIPEPTPVTGLELQQTDSELIWSIDSEIDVQKYQVQKYINGAWVTVIEVLADGSSVYSVEIDADGIYRLLVVDYSGYSEKFYPENGDVEIVSVDLKKGWNLLAMPLDNVTLGEEFVWTWNGESYTISEPNVLDGFWLYSEDDRELIFAGKAPESNQVSLEVGWNLKGPSASCTIDTELLIYSYDEFYNQFVDSHKSLFQGRGYWIFNLDPDGTIDLE